jgi:hypothetical protein
MSTKQAIEPEVLTIDLLAAFLDLSGLLTEYISQNENPKYQNPKITYRVKQLSELSYQLRETIEDEFER